MCAYVYTQPGDILSCTSCVSASVCMCACMFVSMSVHVCVRVCMCVYVRTHTHTYSRFIALTINCRSVCAKTIRQE